MAKSLYIIAGEESGDILGGRLLAALKSKQTPFNIFGIGGSAMQEQGVKSLFPMHDLSVMGVFEIVPQLPRIINRISQTVSDIIAKQPDIVVTIDAPDFCKRVVKKARRHCPNTKFIHYVAPTVWAWREGRAKNMADIFDGLICLLPFEPPYFEKYGMKAQFCGHPIIETIDNRQGHRDRNKILILPGSRRGEIKRMSPVFAETFRLMKTMNPDLEALIPALPHLKDEIAEHFFGMAVRFIDPSQRFAAFKQASFAIATSGTVGLELAVAQCPHVIAYKANALTWWGLQRLVKVKYAHLVNIMEGREVIPECLQENCHAKGIMKAVLHYPHPDLSEIYTKLSGDKSNKSPSHQAADFILDAL